MASIVKEHFLLNSKLLIVAFSDGVSTTCHTRVAFFSAAFALAKNRNSTRFNESVNEETGLSQKFT